MLRTCLITEQEFSQMQSSWNALLRQSDVDSIFLCHEWMFSWWQSFHKGKTLFSIAVRTETDQLVAIAPLYMETLSMSRINSIRVLSFIGCNQIQPDFLGIILNPEYAESAIQEIQRFIAMRQNSWDVFLLDSLSRDHRDNQLLLKALRDEGRYLGLTYDAKCPYINLPHCMDAYLQYFSAKHRKNIKRAVRNLRDRVAYTFVEPGNIEQAEAAMERVFYLHGLRSRTMKRTNGFSDPNVRSFHKLLIKVLFNQSLLKLYSLRIDGVDQALLYGFLYNRRFYYYQSGFNPEYEQYSIGSIMIFHVIERSIALGCEQFEFLRGEEAYKSLWTKESRSIQHVAHFSRRPKGFLLYGIRYGRQFAGKSSRWLRATLKGSHA